MATTRQKVEILALAVVCAASVRTFWRGEGFTRSKQLGIGLALAVFLLLSLILLR